MPFSKFVLGRMDRCAAVRCDCDYKYILSIRIPNQDPRSYLNKRCVDRSTSRYSRAVRTRRGAARSAAAAAPHAMADLESAN